MSYIIKYKNYKFINESSSTFTTKMLELIKYFDKSIDEHIDELPEFFERNYPNILLDWALENSEYFQDDDELDEDGEPIYTYPDGVYMLVYNKEAYEEYCKFLYKISNDAIYNNINDYDLNIYLIPPFLALTKESIDINDEWLVHFTHDKNNVYSILEGGHFLGVPHIDNITITSSSEDTPSPNGYCFAYTIDDAFYNFDRNSGYGTDGIIFKSNGIKVFHVGDDELQVIFIGNTAKNMIGFYQKDNIFYTMDGKISDSRFYEFAEKVLENIS